MGQVNMQLILGISALLFLALASIRDLKTHTLDMALAAAFALWGLLAAFVFKPGGPSAFLPPLLPGFFLVFLSFVTRGAIGLGDAAAVLVLGLYLSLRELAELLFWAFLMAAFYGGIAFVKRRRGGERFAFIPFLLLAFLVLLCERSVGNI